MRAKPTFSLLYVFVVFGLLSIGMSIIPVNSSQAAVPDSINYQGKLTRAGGGPVNGTFDLTFSIYPDDLGSPADWTETQLQVEVEHGVFSVLLGSVNPIQASLFDGSVKYLGVKVEDDPEMTPLKPMVTTSYAFRSQEADTAEYARTAPPDDDWDTDTSGFNIYRFTGNVGIGGLPPPDAKLYVKTDSLVGTYAVYAEGGKPVKGVSTAFEGTGVSGEGGHAGVAGVGGYIGILGQGFYGGWFEGKGYFSGNVGIGTTEPDENLEVDGNAHITGDLTVDGNINPPPVGCWRHSGAQVFSGTGPTSWTDLDLSSHVGSNHALVLLKVDPSGGETTVLRPNGDGAEYTRHNDLSDLGANGVKAEGGEAGIVVCETDANGIVEWKTGGRTTVITLLGYIK